MSSNQRYQLFYCPLVNQPQPRSHLITSSSFNQPIQSAVCSSSSTPHHQQFNQPQLYPIRFISPVVNGSSQSSIVPIRTDDRPFKIAITRKNLILSRVRDTNGCPPSTGTNESAEMPPPVLIPAGGSTPPLGKLRRLQVKPETTNQIAARIAQIKASPINPNVLSQQFKPELKKSIPNYVQIVPSPVSLPAQPIAMPPVQPATNPPVQYGKSLYVSQQRPFINNQPTPAIITQSSQPVVVSQHAKLTFIPNEQSVVCPLPKPIITEANQSVVPYIKPNSVPHEQIEPKQPAVRSPKVDLTCLYCENTFTDKQIYETHSLESHYGTLVTDNFICKICGYCDIEYRRYALHCYKYHSLPIQPMRSQQSMLVPKPVRSCSICRTIFDNNDNLFDHFIVHVNSNAKAYQCRFCQVCFGHTSQFKDHLESVHLVKLHTP